MDEDASWLALYRGAPTAEHLPGREPELSWGGVLAMARGRVFPGAAAAQCVLESGWFQHVTGKHNILGIKAASGEPGTMCITQEEFEGEMITIKDRFKDFDSYQDCIKQLVTQWYLDYKGYTGVNAARSVGECCELLVSEGYATDSAYAHKLMSIINRQSCSSSASSGAYSRLSTNCPTSGRRS